MPLPSASAAAPKRPFSVSDGINRTILYNTVKPFIDSEDQTPFYVSPDESKLIVIAGKGNVKENTYIFQMLMFDLDEVKKSLYKDYSLVINPKILYETKYNKSALGFPIDESGGIRNIFVPENGNKVYFLTIDNLGLFQVFMLDFNNGNITQVSNSSSSIIDYIVDENRGYIIFTTGSAPEKNNECDKNSYRAGVRLMYELYCLRNGKSIVEDYYNSAVLPGNSTLFMQKIGPRTSPIQVLENFTFYDSLRSLLFSPNKEKALLQVSFRSPLPRWQDDPSQAAVGGGSWDGRWLSFAAKMYDENTAVRSPVFYHFVMIDFKRLSARVIDRIPIKDTQQARNTYWSDNSKVHFRGILLKDIADTDDKKEAPIGGAVYDVKDDTFQRELFGKDPRLSLVRRGNAVDVGPADRKSFLGRCRKGKSGFSLALNGEPACYLDLKSASMRLVLRESYNEPPAVYITNKLTGKEKKIFSLNPQFDELTLGSVELLSWLDETGRAWQAGLVLPSDYDSDHRYPLVVQTHGFDPNNFVVEGREFATAPYAAQALANRGMVVLQFPNANEAPHREHPILARGLNSAIHKLIERGLIDETKIGLLGYSALGSFVFRMAAFPEFVPAAVLIADAYDPTIEGYSIFYGAEGLGMAQHELLYCGAMPWGSTQDEWIRRDPYFHLDKIVSPILIEDYNNTRPSWWSVYVGLRRLGRPVDHISFRDGRHPPLYVEIIHKAQELTVDWFDFWLNGRESAEPEKKEQYDVWRKLREQKLALPRVNNSNPSLSTMDCPNGDTLPWMDP